MEGFLKALIDGDIVIFRTAFASDKESEAIAKSRLDSTINRILKETLADDSVIYVSDSKTNNFRYTYNPGYKANRTLPQPRHYSALKSHILKEHNAVIALGQEADDALGIDATASTDTIICTIDKDLKQVPGNHYNFVNQEFDEVDAHEGLFNFYEQLLVGDRIDNIFGVKGIGKAKAPKHLMGCETEQEMFTTVRNLYNDDKRLLTNGICLWVRRKPQEIWQFPK